VRTALQEALEAEMTEALGAVSRWLDGMCSGTVVCRWLPPVRRCAAIRSPCRKISTVRGVSRTSTSLRAKRWGTL
jgi:hypothetical protein